MNDIEKQIEDNAKILGDVMAQEISERKKIQDNLKNFTAAVNQRESEFQTDLQRRHQNKMDVLYEQSAQINSALQNVDVKALEKILREMRN